MTTTPNTSAKSPAAKPATRTAAKPAAKTAAKPAAKTAAKPAAKTVAAAATVSTPDFTKRYKMLTGIDDSEFCTKVGLHLDNGYELYGSPTSTFNGKNVIVGQAVVLKKLPSKKKPGKKK
jgi:hypothetical protein